MEIIEYKIFFEETLGRENVKIDEPMSKHTTFRIGGNADFYLTPRTEEDLAKLLVYCKKNQLDYFILGNGSNILVTDSGYRGIIIDVSALNAIEVEGNRIRSGAGALLRDIAKIAKDHGLSGYEFASGIPGTLGGAVRMNAGAYGGEHADVIEKVRVLDENGQIYEIDAKDMNFSYRHSIVKEKPYTVISATIQLKPDSTEKIEERMRELSKKRLSKQPLDYPSAGSTFKRPPGHYAGDLIQRAGFKGARIGGAQVSEKHAGFIINRENANATDVLELISQIQSKIKEQFGVDIEREVIVLGE